MEEAKRQTAYGMEVCDVLKISDNEIRWFTGEEDFDRGVDKLWREYHIPLILLSMGILQQPQSRTTCIYTGGHDRDDRSGRHVRCMLPTLYSGTRRGGTWHDGAGGDAAFCKCGGIDCHDTTRSAARDAGTGGNTVISCVIGNFIPITQKSSAGMRTSR